MKEKILKKEGICNFTFISGKDKSQINRVRYFLHQMTRETDKTWALMDFVRLIFKVEGKVNLVQSMSDKKKDEKKMAHFLSQFKVKRNIKSCFAEYTRDSFFHKILNTGIRVFRNPE